MPWLAWISSLACPGRALAEPPRGDASPATARERARAYLSRPLRTGTRFVDHGVLTAGVAGGWPHRYRLQLALGLADHLTLGLTAHWLPGQRAPKVAPVLALAVYRSSRFEAGVVYQASLYPPPRNDTDAATPDFHERADWLLTHFGVGHGWFTGGFEFGVVRAREHDRAAVPPDDGSTPSRITYRPGGGLHLRAGTRRWGFSAHVLAPHLYGEVVFELRFGLFELRQRGGWRPVGLVRWSDRARAPRP